MRKSLTFAVLALVLVSLVTATWMGVAAVVLSAPVEVAWLAPLPPVACASLVAVPLFRPNAAALLRGPPSSGFVPCTTRTLNQESAWPENADSPRSSPT